MAFGALAAAFAVALFGQLLIVAIAVAFGSDIDGPTPAVTIVGTFVQDVAFVLAVIAFARATGPLRPAQLGLRRTRLWPAVGAGVLTMLSFYLLSALWAALLEITDSDELPESFGVDESVVAAIAAGVLVTVVAPIAEEVLFRGFFFGALRNWRGPWPAAIVTGVVFGAIHAGGTDPEFLVPLMLLGALLCVLRWRTGSLLPCVAVHAVNNAIAFGVAQLEWGAGPVVVLVVAATAVSLALCWPFLDSSGRAAAARRA